MTLIERTLDIAAPLPYVFDFFADIRNHGRITPPQSREQLLDPGDIPLRKGSVVKLRARYGGLYWTLSSRITAFAPPGSSDADRAYFCDEQVRGPFALWKHEHTFTTLPDGTTRLTDQVRFMAPFGPIGRIAERFWLDREMHHLITYLQDAAKRIIEAEYRKGA